MEVYQKGFVIVDLMYINREAGHLRLIFPVLNVHQVIFYPNVLAHNHVQVNDISDMKVGLYYYICETPQFEALLLSKFEAKSICNLESHGGEPN